MNTYFTVNESKHKTSIDLYEKLASQNYLTVLVFSELLKHIIECQTFLTSNIFWIVRYRILFINYFSKYALKWLLLNYMFMLLNRQLFEKNLHWHTRKYIHRIYKNCFLNSLTHRSVRRCPCYSHVLRFLRGVGVGWGGSLHSNERQLHYCAETISRSCHSHMYFFFKIY